MLTIKPSTAQTDNLTCANCNKQINKGNKVVFILEQTLSGVNMRDVFCNKCGSKVKVLDDYQNYVIADVIGHGQH